MNDPIKKTTEMTDDIGAILKLVERTKTLSEAGAIIGLSGSAISGIINAGNARPAYVMAAKFAVQQLEPENQVLVVRGNNAQATAVLATAKAVGAEAFTV